LFVVFALLALPACSKTGPRKKATVKGTVMFNDKPVTGGSLRFMASAGKGNTAPVTGFSQISPQGEYELTTDRGANVDVGEGLPLGWYLVVYSPPKKDAPAVDARYQRMDSTPLEIEVVEEPKPGQYDIRLK
jgi:hypothetical protein